MASSNVPYRQIRAKYTSTTITLYQAYNIDIAAAAVNHQKLNASPKFKTTRMTWIKPSWAWMLYRSGYSYKDKGQECILALTLDKDKFISLLRKSIVASKANATSVAKEDVDHKTAKVRVQWDPERTISLEKLPYRSIQIGIPGALMGEYMESIVAIEDVTERARRLKKLLDDDQPLDTAKLDAEGLIPEEKELEVDEDLEIVLCMDKNANMDEHI